MRILLCVLFLLIGCTEPQGGGGGSPGSTTPTLDGAKAEAEAK